MQSLANPLSQLVWRNRFATLGNAFYTLVNAAPLREVQWVARSDALAHTLGLPDDWWQSNTCLQALAGNEVLPGSQPLASVYSGHQFGVWAGQLGDGRALWLGEIDTPLGPQEVQLKGAGLTPYSRMGDGRAVLRSSIREFLCSEAMHGLGIPTTRALAIVASPDKVLREELETAAVVTRVAPSFLRFGHFEHFAALGRQAELKQLADFAIRHYFPHLLQLPDGPERYLAMLEQVVLRTASLLAHWQSVGFCHGVMNTDNMSLLGLTIDYGPFQFLDGFDPAHICNHSDHQGRYAFARQPQVAFWNLYCLGQALMPLIQDQDASVEVLDLFKTAYPLQLDKRMVAKLGLSEVQTGDHELVDGVFKLLTPERTDVTIFWRRLSHAVASYATSQDLQAFQPVTDMFIQADAWQTWLASYLKRLGSHDLSVAGQQMLVTNPKFVLRNHLGEQAIRQAKMGDFSGVSTLLTLLSSPFDEHPGFETYAAFPPDWASSIAISCSS